MKEPPVTNQPPYPTCTSHNHTLSAQLNPHKWTLWRNLQPPNIHKQIQPWTKTTNCKIHIQICRQMGVQQEKTIKNFETNFESLMHIRCTNYKNLRIPIHTIHGKTSEDHLPATKIFQSQFQTLPKPRNRHVATPTIHLHPPTHKMPLYSMTQQSNTPNSPHARI